MIREEREHRRERIRSSGRDRNRRAGARWGGAAQRREPERAQWRRWGEGQAGAAQEGRAPPVPRCPGRRPASSACRVPGNRARLPGGGGARGEVTLHQVPGRSRPGGQRCGVRVREDGEPWRGRESGQGAGRGEGGKAAAAAALPEPWKHSFEGRPRPSFWDPRVPAGALLGVASLAFRPRRRVNRSPTASSNPRAQCLPQAVRLSPQNARVWTEPAWSGRVRSDMGRRAATCAHPLLPQRSAGSAQLSWDWAGVSCTQSGGVGTALRHSPAPGPSAAPYCHLYIPVYTLESGPALQVG